VFMPKCNNCNDPTHIKFSGMQYDFFRVKWVNIVTITDEEQTKDLEAIRIQLEITDHCRDMTLKSLVE
jgi:hypothetical protein